jgi:pimeloyl-ACP methyl ester carboxylesterase
MSYRAATQAFPEMVPERADADGVAASREAAAFWRDRWQGRSMMAIGAQDPVFTPASMERLRQQIRGCPPPMLIPNGGHFVQEHGEQIAVEALRRML